MIKLKDILENKILVPRRSEERQKKYQIIIQKQIQQYIKDGGKGDLDLSSTLITSLPDGLKVGGNLYLSNTPITSLPNGLEIGLSLQLDFTLITSLPNDLKVRKNIHLFSTPITSLPNGLEVGGDLYLSNTPLSKKYTEEQIQQMVPGVKGDIYI